jgi:hypothetical protein
MANSTIEVEIVTLVQEISRLEKNLDEAQRNARTWKNWSQGEKYAEEAKGIEDKISRKLQLLTILKG